MTKFIKKLSAVAMAVTLLGTGSVITQNDSMKASAINSTVTMYGDKRSHCDHNCGRYMSHGNWQTCWYNKHRQIRKVEIFCYNCGGGMSMWWEERYI